MLLCPFCQTEIDDDKLRAGRCSQCGGLVMWEDSSEQHGSAEELFTMASIPSPLPPDQPQASSPVPPAAHETTREENSEPSDTPSPSVTPSPSSGSSSDSSDDCQVPQTIFSDTFLGQPDEGTSQKTPPLAPFTSVDSPDATIRFSPNTPQIPREEQGLPFSSPSSQANSADIGRTLPRRVDTHRSISVRSLSSREADHVNELWRGTYSPASSPYMTIKNTGVGSEQNADTVIVKTRVVQEAGKKSYERPDYTLLEQIGEGGVGVVYAATQTSINRTVALKMLRPYAASDQDAREKFLAEAAVTGELDHPNIVPIYDLGADEKGAAFYSMKRVEGTPWSAVMKAKRIHENLDILMKVADAVAFAHDREVIHRDLKPENVMLGNFGEVLVMDWGIALSTSAYLRQGSVRQSNSMGGTPAYMAPEMATGPLQMIGPRSDVYLLGALLFEILTGLTPHTGHDVLSCLQAAARNEIQHTEVEGELIDIAYQAMATDLDQRYQSVHEFQEAIRTYQSHSESIALVARADDDLHNARSTQDYQDYSRALFAYQEALALWPENVRAAHGIEDTQLAYATTALSKGDVDLGLSLMDEQRPSHRVLRRKLLAAQHERDLRQKVLRRFRRIAVALGASIILVLSVGLYFLNRANSAYKISQAQLEESIERETAEKRNAQTEKDRADDQRDYAEAQRIKAQELNQDLEQTITEVMRERERADAEADKARRQKQEADRLSYVAQIGLAAAQVEENAFLEARGVISSIVASSDESESRARWRHWEWGRLSFLSDRADDTEPAGARVERVAWMPDGRRLLVATAASKIRIWNAESGTFLARELPLAGAASALAISHDGQWAAAASAAGGSIHIWDLEKVLSADSPAEPVPHAEWIGHTDIVHNLRYSTDGRFLVSSSQDGTARIWNTESGESEGDLVRHSGPIRDAVMSPDNRFVYMASEDRYVTIWDREASNRSGRFDGHRGPVYALAVAWDEASQSSRVISAGKDRFVLAWNPDQVGEFDYDELQRRLRAADRGESSPRNNSSLRNTKETQIQVFAGHTGEVRTLRVSPDGRSVVSGGHDNTVRVWNLWTDDPQPAPHRVLRGHGGWVRSAEFHPQDGHVVSGGFDGQVKFWDVENYAEYLKLDEHTDGVLTLSYSPDGSKLITADREGRALIWDAHTGQLLQELKEGHDWLASTVAFFPPGDDRFTTSAGDGTTIIWGERSGGAQRHLLETGQNSVVDVSADGRWLATGSLDNTVKVWRTDPSFGQTDPLELKGHQTPILVARFLPRADESGTLLFTGDERGRGILWRYSKSKEEWQLAKQLTNISPGERIVAARFRADGSRLHVASESGLISQWRIPEGEEITEERWRPTTGRVRLLEISPDDQHAVIAYIVESREKDDLWGLQYWDLNTLELKNDYELDPGINVFSLAFDTDHGGVTPEEVIVATNHDQNSVWRWAPYTDELKPYWKGRGLRAAVWMAAPVPNRRQLVTISGNSARLWDSESGQRVQSHGPHRTITTASFSPDGQRVVTAGTDGTAKIWDLSLGQVLIRVPPEHVIDARAATIHAARFAPRPSLFGAHVGEHPAVDVLLTVGHDGTARLWGLRDDQAEVIRVIDVNGRRPILSANFSPDGRLFVTGSSDGIVRVWDSLTGEIVRELMNPEGNQLPINHVVFSPDGSRIASGGDDNVTVLWDTTTWKLKRLEGHTAPVTSVAFSLDLRRVLTASKDGTAKLWDTETEDEVFTLKGHSEEVTAAKFSPDGRQVATACADGNAIIWLADDISPTLTLRRDPLVYRHPREAALIDPEAELGAPFARDYSQCRLRVRVMADIDNEDMSSAENSTGDASLDRELEKLPLSPDSDLEQLGVREFQDHRLALTIQDDQVLILRSGLGATEPERLATIRPDSRSDEVELVFDIHESADRFALEWLLRNLTYTADWKTQAPNSRRVIIELMCGDEVPESERRIEVERNIRFEDESPTDAGANTARITPSANQPAVQSR
jgi:WD40 repeat protein